MDSFKKTAHKTLLNEISAATLGFQALSTVIGTFDHADKTLDEVTKYGIESWASLPGRPRGNGPNAYFAAKKPHRPARPWIRSVSRASGPARSTPTSARNNQ